MDALYTAAATATTGRTGRVISDDGILDVDLTTPKGLGGAGGSGTNPEQLFAAGYSACFCSALMLVAKNQKVAAGHIAITAKVSIGKEGEGFGLAVELVGSSSALPADQLLKLMQAAHQVCAYSKATRGNIEVKLSTA